MLLWMHALGAVECMLFSCVSVRRYSCIHLNFLSAQFVSGGLRELIVCLCMWNYQLDRVAAGFFSQSLRLPHPAQPYPSICRGW
jgi:hypothetical protein